MFIADRDGMNRQPSVCVRPRFGVSRPAVEDDAAAW